MNSIIPAIVNVLPSTIAGGLAGLFSYFDGTVVQKELKRNPSAHDGRVAARTAQIALATWQCMKWIPIGLQSPVWAAAMLAMPITATAIKEDALTTNNPYLKKIGIVLDTISPCVFTAAKIASIIATATTLSTLSPVLAGGAAIGLTVLHFVGPLNARSPALLPATLPAK